MGQGFGEGSGYDGRGRATSRNPDGGNGMGRDVAGCGGSGHSNTFLALGFSGDGLQAGGQLSRRVEAGSKDIHPQKNRQLLFAGLRRRICGVFSDEDWNIRTMCAKYSYVHQAHTGIWHFSSIYCTQSKVTVLAVQVMEVLRCP